MSQELQLLRVSAGDYDPTAESRKWNPPLREAGDIWLMLYYGTAVKKIYRIFENRQTEGLFYAKILK